MRTGNNNKYPHVVNILTTTKPYRTLPHKSIQYSVCRDYDHISRYRNLRQVVHCPDDDERMIDLETPNPIAESNLKFTYYDVTPDEENRIDIISDKALGSAHYNWAISYFNEIHDGFTVKSGQKLSIPKDITSLMKDGNILQSITALQMNLGSE